MQVVMAKDFDNYNARKRRLANRIYSRRGACYKRARYYNHGMTGQRRQERKTMKKREKTP